MKKNKEFTNWENSLEGIHYNLNRIGFGAVDEDNRELVVKTLKKMPKKVRDYILENVCFIDCCIAGYVAEISIYSKQERQLLIVLNFKNMIKDEMMDVVAHECAHIILGHNTMKQMTNKKNEREADNLIEKWGFNCTYLEKDYPDNKK